MVRPRQRIGRRRPWDPERKDPIEIEVNPPNQDWRVKFLGALGIGIGTYLTKEGADGLVEIKAPVNK